jgi:signal transduction histidine kinase
MVAGDEERARLAARLALGPLRRMDEIAHALEALPGVQGDAHSSRALEHVRRASVELGSLAEGLHPQELAEEGLAGALRSVAGRAPLTVEVDVEVPDLPEPVQVAAYFVVSEALANVAKHARASRARICARVAHEVLVVEVDDDGSGGADPAGSGLVGLADRVSALGGTLEVASPPGHGTRITARMPVADGTS